MGDFNDWETHNLDRAATTTSQMDMVAANARASALSPVFSPSVNPPSADPLGGEADAGTPVLSGSYGRTGLAEAGMKTRIRRMTSASIAR